MLNRPAPEETERAEAASSWRSGAGSGRAPLVWPMQVVLPLALGLVLLLALLPVMTAGFIGARDNTQRLLRASNDAVVDGLEDLLKATLDPVAAQMATVARLIGAGRIDPNDRLAFRRFMIGVVTGQSNAVGVGFLEADGPFRRWSRDLADETLEPRESAPFADEIWTSAQIGEGPTWHRPFVSRITRSPVLLHRQPVFREGRLLGVFMTAITAEAISDFVMNMNTGIMPFVLVDKRTVIVHPNIRSAPMEGFDLPGIDAVGDPALAVMWTDPRRPALVDPLARSKTHWSWVGTGYTAHQYHYREISGYGPEPWIVGFHQNSLATFRERWVVQGLFYGSGLVLLLVMLAAWHMGRVAARPAEQIAAAARDLEELDFDLVRRPALETSRIAEVRSTAQALGRAANALRRFQTYVPRALVQQLMTMGEERTAATDREVTVLFMDLAGYSAYSEGRSAEEVGRYLNAVFARIGPIIEAAGGTIDKYTGDGLLAVWGAPMTDPDHAARAWHATCEIRDRLLPHVAALRQADPRSCRMRLGLHTGRVLAGDLGFEGRMDYTVVGTTVNLAQRAQAALKASMGDELVCIAISDTMRRAIGLGTDRLEPLAPVGGEALYKVPASLCAEAQLSLSPSRAIREPGRMA